MNKKTFGAILILLALGLMIYWWASGGSIWTVTKVQVPVTDELFGTQSMEWHDEYRPGLLPFIGPISFMLATIGIWLNVRRRKHGSRALQPQ